MSFQIGDWVKIVNPNHYRFGFEGVIMEICQEEKEAIQYKVFKRFDFGAEAIWAFNYEIKLINEDAPDAIRYFVERKTETATATEYEPYDYFKEKGEKDNMKILNIYEDRKSLEIAKKYKEEIEKTKSEDTFESLRLNVEKQVKELYKNEYNKEFSGIILFESDCEARLLTKETKDKLAEIETNKKIELSELDEFLEEVRAQLELAKDYETQMKILKRYNIIGKDGKINA